MFQGLLTSYSFIKSNINFGHRKLSKYVMKLHARDASDIRAIERMNSRFES